MSVIENIQKLLKTRSVQPEDSMVMASAGGAGDSLAANSVNAGDRISDAEAEKDIFAAAPCRPLTTACWTTPNC